MKLHKRFQYLPLMAVGLSTVLSASAEILLSEDFEAGSGGFEATSTGEVTGPWTYQETLGTWTVDGDDALEAPTSNMLTSPPINVATDELVRIRLVHRFSFEAEWDGAAISISLNDGPFEVVEAENFRTNGYTFFNLIGNHPLNGGEGFNGDSPGYTEREFITSDALIEPFSPGDVIRVQLIGGWDEFTRGQLPNWEIDAFTVETLPDTDGDGIYDEYEDQNGLDKEVDDAGEDLDSDGSTNSEEFELFTDPTNPDTDDDGLLDGVETNTGTFVDATDTGTDPLNLDTDSDGLLDGVETGTGIFVDASDTGTNPMDSDTDDDGDSDGREVAERFDPTNPESFPPKATVEILGVGVDFLLGGDLTDPENDGNDTAGPDDASWNWVSIESSDAPTFDGEGSYNVFDNQVGGGAAKWCCAGAAAGPRFITVELEVPHLITHFTVTSGNDTPTRDPIDWEIQGSNDGVTFIPIFSQISETTSTIWDARDQVALITLPTPSPAYKFIRYYVTRTGDANHQVNELEYFGIPASEEPNLIASTAVNLGEVSSIRETVGGIQIRNSSFDEELTISDIRIVGTDAEHFSITDFPDSLGSLNSGNSGGLIGFSFDPLRKIGGFNATVEIDTNDADNPTTQVLLSARIPNVVGPIAHYRLDDTTSTLSDASGNGEDGTYGTGGTLAQGEPGLTDTSGTAVGFSGGALANVPGSAFPVLGSFSLSLWLEADNTSDTIEILVAKGDDEQVTFALAKQGTGLAWLVGLEVVHQGGTGSITAGTVHHVVAVLNQEEGAESLTFYVDGEEVFTIANPTVVPDTTEASLSIGAFRTGALFYNGLLDDVQIYPRALTAEDIAFLAANPGSVPLPDDLDGDGMPDEFEDLYGLNKEIDDSAEDLDSDGLTNIEEYDLGTAPSNPDTDEDSLTDGVETDTGTFVDATDTGTNPLVADTDGDGLLDGVETGTGSFTDASDTGTDPLIADTDGDGDTDGVEVSTGYDPNDPASFAPRPTIELVGTGTEALLGSDLTDPENDGNDTLGPDDPSWNWVSIETNDTATFDGEGTYNVFDNLVGGGAAKWCCTGAGAEPRWLTIELAVPHHITHFTITSGNDTPGRDPLDWQILGSNDGETFTPIFTQSAETAIWTARDQVASITLVEPSAAYRYIRYEVSRTGDGNHQIGELEYFGNPEGEVPVDTDSDGDGVLDADELIAGTDPNDPLSIFTVTATSLSDGNASLVWASVTGKTYRIYYSPDLVEWTEIGSLAAEDLETLFVDSDEERLSLGEGYYRVQVE